MVKRMKPTELRNIVNGLGITQKQLAKAMGVTEASVSRWINGRHNIPKHIGVAVRLWARDYKKAG